MSATVYSAAKFGITSEASSTGLHAANISYAGVSETAVAPNHVGQDVGLAIFNESIDVTIDGVIATKGAGLVVGLADIVTLANTAADSLTVTTNLLKATPNANAAVVITGGGLKRSNNGFEMGDLSGVFKPGVATNAVSTAS
jgi:hypothetical protein